MLVSPKNSDDNSPSRCQPPLRDPVRDTRRMLARGAPRFRINLAAKPRGFPRGVGTYHDRRRDPLWSRREYLVYARVDLPRTVRMRG